MKKESGNRKNRRKGTAFLSAAILFVAFFFTEPEPVSAEDTSSLQDWITYEYDETNGLPTGEANAVLQTADGYIWIGSYGGLIRYDGTVFRNYSSEGAIPSSSIRALFEDSQGRLWIGTNDRGVYLYEDQSFVQYPCSEAQEFLSVRAFAETGDGTVYAGTTSGLARIGQQELVPVEDGTDGMTIYSMAVDKNDVLWACIDDGKALLLSDGQVTGSFDSDGLLSAPLYCVDTGTDGSLYLGTSENMIYRLEFKDDKYSRNSYSLQKYMTGEASTVNDIAQDAQGNIWIAALNGAGYLDETYRWNPVSAEHATAVNVVTFDYEGNVWLASTSYGIVQLVEGLYYNVNEAAGLSDTSINTVKVCGDYYYLGTDTGLIILDENFHPVENALTEMLKGERIRDLLYDREGNIWIGTYYQYGLLLYDPDEDNITAYTQEDGLCDNQIRMILECSDGRIAVATQNGVAILDHHEILRTYTEEDGLSYPVILCLCEGADGTLYAGSDGQGIYAIQGEEITHYSFDEGLSSGVVLRMLADDKGRGLFISAGNSLYYWDFDAFYLLENYKKSPGSIFDMALVDEDLWLMQSNGVHILNRETLLSGRETPTEVIGVSEGLTGTLNANNWNDEKDGVFYLCTSSGISILNKEDLSGRQPDIQGCIYQVIVDDTVYEIPEQVNLDGYATRLTFRFAALSYSGQERRVSYQLKGFDEEAHILTNDQPMSASYTNLSGGDYEFVLEILGEDGESQGVSCSVSIHKDYLLWEHVWFWISAGVAGLLFILFAVWLCFHIKTLRLRRRQEEYQSIVRQALQTFANTIDAKDKYTNGHSMRVAAYSVEIAKKLKLSEEEQERIYYIALLHDIGKIGISDEILNKPGKLTPEERQIIMSHPSIGGDILKDFTSLPGISEGARYHHERYDGQGYNEGLKGEEIPFVARIICVADSYDAMSSVRCYRKSLDTERIVEELKQCSGTQFDPQIVEIMLELIQEGKVPISLEEEGGDLDGV